ncbi:MAG TPA: TolC family protein, partial [Myxococcota bacterium]|nr:TolC family protein [Myxococcota bacterium]
EKKAPKPSELSAKGAVVPLEEAKKRALENRVEVKQLTQRLAMAERAVNVATSKMAPSVNLVAAAQFTGGSEFQQEAAAFVGLTFDWTVWEWGATKYGIDEARARVREVKARTRQLQDGVALETEAAWVEHASALDQAELAAEAVKVAGVNYELVRKRFEAKAATSFDVVEAENALTRARLDEKMASVAALMARAKLARAMGGDAKEIAREGAP